MNDVRITQAVMPPRPVVSTVAVDAKNNSTVSAEVLPNEALKKASESKTVDKADENKEAPKSHLFDSVETAVAKVNEYVQSIERNLQFSVDKELDKTVVKVVDGTSGELIRQIPDEVFLELAKRLTEDGELRLMNALS